MLHCKNGPKLCLNHDHDIFTIVGTGTRLRVLLAEGCQCPPTLQMAPTRAKNSKICKMETLKNISFSNKNLLLLLESRLVGTWRLTEEGRHRAPWP